MQQQTLQQQAPSCLQLELQKLLHSQLLQVMLFQFLLASKSGIYKRSDCNCYKKTYSTIDFLSAVSHIDKSIIACRLCIPLDRVIPINYVSRIPGQNTPRSSGTDWYLWYQPRSTPNVSYTVRVLFYHLFRCFRVLQVYLNLDD